MTSTPLSTIIALARAGALDHAWAQFLAAGYDEVDEPAALTVKGRLLKDQALRSGDEAARRAFYLRSAEAYGRAAALRPATYPLINAASLSLLSGDRAQAEETARAVLERIAREPDEPETPYYRAATEAEALLLLGRRAEAETALAAAVAAAPEAWEDHASTLRQLLVIAGLLGEEVAWLDRLRPPDSLGYAGDGDWDAEAMAQLERAGFGFGGAAPGRELASAETLVARGAALHLILPAGAEAFAAECVDPAGPAVRRRFDAVLAAAESVRALRPLDGPADASAVALATRLARGAALLNAERLMGRAVLIGDPGVAAAGALALLAIGVGDLPGPGFEHRLSLVRQVLGAASDALVPPHLSGETILVGYAGVGRAASVARALREALEVHMPLRIAGHYGLIACVRDPFSGALRPKGEGADILAVLIGATPPGSLCVSEDFAAALAAEGNEGEAVWIGELQAHDGGPAIGLYTLRARAG